MLHFLKTISDRIVFVCLFGLLFAVGCDRQGTSSIKNEPVKEEAGAIEPAPSGDDSAAQVNSGRSRSEDSLNRQPNLVDASQKRSSRITPSAEKMQVEGELTMSPDGDVSEDARPLFEGEEAKKAQDALKVVQEFDPEDYQEPELTPEQKQKMESLQKEADLSRANQDSFLKMATEAEQSGDSSAEVVSEPPLPESDLPEGALDPNSPNYDWKAALNAKPKPLDLGEPLVDQPEELSRLHPTQNIWYDKRNKEVVLLGAVAQNRGSLELFACAGRIGKDVFGNIMPNGAKAHESVVILDITPHLLHAALLAANAQPGRPAVFSPTFEPPTGEEIDILVRWKGSDGTVQQAKAGDWIVDEQTGASFKEPFVFTGSMFMVNANTGKRMYMADVDGELICVSNFPAAILDIPIESSSSDFSRLYMANEKTVPERGTPVTLILRPVVKTPTVPLSAEPVSSEPVSTEPVSTEPVSTEPVSTEPVPTEPVSTEPVSTEPVSPEPVSTEPVSPEPVSTEPVSTEPVSTEPVSSEPGFVYNNSLRPSISVSENDYKTGSFLRILGIIVRTSPEA